MENLDEKLEQFSREEIIGILKNYVAMHPPVTPLDGDGKTCEQKHAGLCGVCINQVWIPCG